MYNLHDTIATSNIYQLHDAADEYYLKVIKKTWLTYLIIGHEQNQSLQILSPF